MEKYLAPVLLRAVESEAIFRGVEGRFEGFVYQTPQLCFVHMKASPKNQLCLCLLWRVTPSSLQDKNHNI